MKQTKNLTTKIVFQQVIIGAYAIVMLSGCGSPVNTEDNYSLRKFTSSPTSLCEEAQLRVDGLWNEYDELARVMEPIQDDLERSLLLYTSMIEGFANSFETRTPEEVWSEIQALYSRLKDLRDRAEELQDEIAEWELKLEMCREPLSIDDEPIPGENPEQFEPIVDEPTV